MIKIALISDIHFGSDARGDFSTNSIGEINTDNTMSYHLIKKLKELEPDYLFIAGDLTSKGTPAEFHYCEEKLLDIIKKANISLNNVIWCVGNHDVDWNISKLSEKYTKHNEGESYNQQVEDTSVKQYSKIAARAAELTIEKLKVPSNGVLPINGIHEDENMIVFIINSSSKCLHNKKTDHGEITAEQLDWFKNEAEKFRNDSRWKIVLLHHHPFNYPFPDIGIDDSLLSDGSEFLEIAGKNGINLILHGHRHHPRCKTQLESNWVVPISFISAGSLSVNDYERLDGDIPNMFHFIELEENKGGLFLLSLKSFMYTTTLGWHNRFENNGKTITIDPVMKLGQLVSKERMIKAIEDMAIFNESSLSLSWDELNEDLQYCSSLELNELILNTLGDRFVIRAELPKWVRLQKKENNE